MAKQIVFNVSGIEGDAFETAEIVFPEELGGTRAGNDRVVRKKPGRTTYHQIVLTPDEYIPEPAHPVDVTVNLYDSSKRLVATGTDTVAPPGDADVSTPEPVLARLDSMLVTIEEIQGTLRRCKDDLCSTVLEHSFARKNYTQSAKAAAEDGEYASARSSLRSVRRIVEGDIELLEAEGESAIHDETLRLERRLLGETIAAQGVMPGDNVSLK